MIRNFLENEEHVKRWSGADIGDEPEDEDLDSIMSRRTHALRMMNELDVDASAEKHGRDSSSR